MPATAPGIVMGTVGYMSPEQASGQASDFRSDQFSFGAILYEMATGKRAFQRNTAVETLSAIIRDDPEPIASINPAAPMPVRWIVETCLAKDPEERYASTRDLARDLKQALSHVSDVAVEAPSPARRRVTPKGMWLAAAALAGLALAGLGFYAGRRTVPAPTGLAATLRRVTFAPGLEEDPALSPDGKFVAYATDEKGNLDLVVLPLEGGQAIRIAESEADEAQPAWSPDGTKLAFVSARDRGGRLAAVLGQGALTQYLLSRKGDIFIVPALGGEPAKLVEDGYYPAWSPDGRKVVFQSNRDGRWDLWTVPAEGGTPARLTNDESFDFQPSWSSDGNWIVYGSGIVPYYNVRVVPAAGGTPRDLTAEKSSTLRPVWSADGRSILFSWDQNGIVNVWRIPFSSDKGRAPGMPARVTIGQGYDAGVAVGRDGQIAFSTVRGSPDIWELDRSSGHLRQITSETGVEDHPVPSPDGKTLLVVSDRSGESAIWTLDPNGRFLTQLAPNVGFARWAPDGREVAFTRENRMFLQLVGGLSARDIGRSGRNLSFSPDGRHIAFSDPAADGAGRENIWISAVMKEGAARRVTSQNANNGFPTWSPDGRHLAFQSQVGGTRHLWIVPADGGEPRQLTRGDSEESHPTFSPHNPDEILFLRDHREICLIAVSTGKITTVPAELTGRVLLDYPYWSPDGRRIYFSVTRRTGDVYLLEPGSSFRVVGGGTR